MKLNKSLKKTALLAMAALATAALSFTGIANYVYGAAQTEANFEGYQSREKNLVKKSFFTKGATIKTKITGKFTAENYTPSADAMMSFVFIDTSEAADYWKDLTSGCDVKLSDCLDSEGNVTFEFTDNVIRTALGSQEDILFFLHSDDKTAYEASGKFVITGAQYTITKEDGNSNDSGNQGPTSKTSIKTNLQTGDNVWGAGASLTGNANGTYTGTAAGNGEGGWGGNLAVIIASFGAGELSGYTHAVVDMDLSSYSLAGDDPTYPAIELKVGTETLTKMVNATSNYDSTSKSLTVAFPSDVDLTTADRIQFTIRGSGTFTLSDISKAK